MPDPAPPDYTAADALRHAAAEIELMQDQLRALLSPEQNKKAQKMRADRLPSSPEAKAMADLFKRRHSTPWSVLEIEAFCAAKGSGEVTMSNLALLASYYEQERSKGSEGCHRRDLLVFCRHFLGELDRARNSPAQRRLEKARQAQPKAAATERKPTEEELARIAADASARAAQVRAGINGRSGA